ncbi:hypothetical protein COD67_16025 [Bacillus cereus]|nr:hypothetical protein COI89_09900 [Bacillus cereus]PGU65355.1 hypothetical protein COD67_16025 [Bacillus cereus]
MNRGKNYLYEEKPEHYYNGVNPNLLKHIKKKWKEVLDIGCSDGAIGAVIKENGARVSGIEVFPEAAEKAKERLDHVILGDIETMDIPYEKEQFDCVIFGDVLEHLFDPWTVIEKVKPYLFDGFDFYDVSQSFEFRKAGYTVDVPVQRDAWCIHYHFDVNMTNYEKYQKIFVENYKTEVNKEE